MIVIFMTCLCLISIGLMMVNFVLSMMPNLNREKYSIFECGFDPSASSRLPFSMHFFLVALIFLIFDVEISLLVPLPMMWHAISHNAILWVSLGVLSILLGGALVEWVEGSLEWQS